jgi:predicted dehydrogenase
MRRDAKKAKDFAYRHNVPTFYSNAMHLIHDPDVNAIYIATPPDSHELFAIEAMKAGKPVYIEKPVAVSSKACQNMIEASNTYKIPATVAHYRRSLAIFERVKSLIDKNAIGHIRLVTLNLFQSPKPTTAPDLTENWRINPDVSGGGILFDLAPHQLDILYWIFGAPQVMKGLSVNQGKSYNAPDVSALSAVFKDNILFQGLWSFNSPAHALTDACKIIGDTGTIAFPFFSSAVESKLSIDRGGKVDVEEFIFPQHIQQPMIESVVSYFQGKRGNPCSLNESLVSLRMIEEAYAS